MYAIIKTGGKQYRVAKGDLIDVERLEGSVGDEINFDQVLLVGGGDEPRVGDPLVQNASVLGTITEQGKGDKVVVFKFKRRKMYRRRAGHRQLLSRVRIEEIQVGGKSAPAAAGKAKARKPAAKKTSAKKAAAKKPEVKKAAARKSTARKSTARKSTARKTTTKGAKKSAKGSK